MNNDDEEIYMNNNNNDVNQKYNTMIMIQEHADNVLQTLHDLIAMDNRKASWMNIVPWLQTVENIIMNVQPENKNLIYVGADIHMNTDELKPQVRLDTSLGKIYSVLDNTEYVKTIDYLTRTELNKAVYYSMAKKHNITMSPAWSRSYVMYKYKQQM